MFVTDPENQLTELWDKLGHDFYAEGKIPGGFHVEHWKRQWTLLIKAKLGFMWIARDGDKPFGGLGIILSPDLCDGELVVQEAFWYIAPEYRNGSFGIRLLKAAESFAIEAGAARMLMGRIHAADPENRVDRVLGALGYKPFETNYVKTLCHTYVKMECQNGLSD